MKSTYKFRIYPSKDQISKLNNTLDTCRWVYNQTLSLRKESYEKNQLSLSKYDTHKYLTSWKDEHPFLREVNAQVLQNVQERVDLAFQGFFRRVKNHENPGYPRFKGKGYYDSFTYPQYGFKILESKELYLSKIGNVKIKYHREIEGTIKRLTIQRTIRNKWYTCFSVVKDSLNEIQPNGLHGEAVLKHDGIMRAVGIDMGIKTFATLSDGNTIEYPFFFKEEQENLKRVQQKLSKAKKGSREYIKHLKVVQRIHERTGFRRDNFAHQESKVLVNNYGLICFEDLDTKSMLENGTKSLSRNIMDASWNKFLRLTQFKAESAGSRVVLVDPKNTSQICSRCGFKVVKDLKERTHSCPMCGLEMDRDLNAALNILRLGLQSVSVGSYRSPSLNAGE